MTGSTGRTAAIRVGDERPLRAVIDGRTHWIRVILRDRESQLRAHNDGCCTRKERSGRRVSGGTAPVLILLFVHEGLKPTNRLASDVHQPS